MRLGQEPRHTLGQPLPWQDESYQARVWPDQGYGRQQMYVEKYEYATIGGEARTLVLAVPVMSSAAYNQAVQNANLPWLLRFRSSWRLPSPRCSS